MINFYRIVSNNTPKVYIGSTSESINTRLSKHKDIYKRYLKGEHRYVTSFEILEFKDYSIQLIETKECLTIDDRNTIERYHILNNPTAVNKQQPGRTRPQYYSDNKNQIDEYKKQWYIENSDRIKQKNKTKITCICGSIYSQSNKARHKKAPIHINYILQHP